MLVPTFMRVLVEGVIVVVAYGNIFVAKRAGAMPSFLHVFVPGDFVGQGDIAHFATIWRMVAVCDISIATEGWLCL